MREAYKVMHGESITSHLFAMVIKSPFRLDGQYSGIWYKIQCRKFLKGISKQGKSWTSSETRTLQEKCKQANTAGKLEVIKLLCKAMKKSERLNKFWKKEAQQLEEVSRKPYEKRYTKRLSCMEVQSGQKCKWSERLQMNGQQMTRSAGSMKGASWQSADPCSSSRRKYSRLVRWTRQLAR